MLSSHLRLGLPSGFFPSGFPIKILYALLLFPIPATCRTHFFILDLITRIVFGSPLSSVFQSPVTSSLLNISVSSLFSNTLSVCFSLSVQDQVSRPQKTTERIISLCIITCKFLGRTLERQKILHSIIAIIPCLNFVFNFFLNEILIC